MNFLFWWESGSICKTDLKITDDYCYNPHSYYGFHIWQNRKCLVICAFYSEYGVCTEDVAVVVETFPFKLKDFFSILKKKIYLYAYFESRVSSFNIYIYIYIWKVQPKNSLLKLHKAEPAYSRLLGHKESCLLKEKSIMTGVE